MLKKSCLILLCLMPLLIFNGCYDQQIFENTAIIIYAGAETAKEEEEQLTFSFAAADNEESKGKLRLFSKNDALFEDSIAALNNSSENPLKAGKIQNIFLSDELAAKGILTVEDINRLSVTNRFMADYAVVEGSPKELLSTLEKMKLKSNAYGYIEELIHNAAVAGLCPNTRRHEFNIDLETDGVDPVLPLLTYNEEKKTIKIKGTALFQGDRYVEKLSLKESRYLTLLTGSAEQCAVVLKDLEENRDVTLNITDAKHKVDIDIIDGQLFLTHKIKLRSYFGVSDWSDLPEAEKTSINKKAENKLKKSCYLVLEKLQTAGSDPFAVGAKLRAYHNNFFQNNDVLTAYQNAVIKVELENKLTNQENP